MQISSSQEGKGSSQYFGFEITESLLQNDNFEDRAYQFKVLPFGLALAPRTFTKCINAALSPLKQSVMHILNYLDNWLIIAQSQNVLESHKH